jgi:hypothetical protein
MPDPPLKRTVSLTSALFSAHRIQPYRPSGVAYRQRAEGSMAFCVAEGTEYLRNFLVKRREQNKDEGAHPRYSDPKRSSLDRR